MADQTDQNQNHLLHDPHNYHPHNDIFVRGPFYSSYSSAIDPQHLEENMHHGIMLHAYGMSHDESYMNPIMSQLGMHTQQMGDLHDIDDHTLLRQEGFYRKSFQDQDLEDVS